MTKETATGGTGGGGGGGGSIIAATSSKEVGWINRVSDESGTSFLK